MLKIMEFAKMVGTTRRTLIFYEQEGIFQPAHVTSNGYRYYSYDQIYRFEIISSLRQAGLTIKQIKAVLDEKDPQRLLSGLQQSLSRLTKKAGQLQQSIEAVRGRINDLQSHHDGLQFNQPRLIFAAKQCFWCSDTVEACAAAEMAIKYSAFSKKLTQHRAIIADNGGFLTNVALENYHHYPHASFRFTHACRGSNQPTLPQIIKPAGRYLTIKTRNNNQDIVANLHRLARYCKEQRLVVAPVLWQFNTNFDVKTMGSSPAGILQYQVIGKDD